MQLTVSTFQDKERALERNHFKIKKYGNSQNILNLIQLN